MKRGTLLVVVLLLSMLLAGQTKLVIWCSEKQVDILQKLGEEYKAKRGVEVEVQQVDFGSIKPKFQNAAPAGQGADIIVGAHDWVGELAANGLIEPIPQFDELNAFYKTAIQAFSYGGKLYGLPYAMEAIALIYNKKYVPEPPQLIEDLIELAETIDEEYEGDVRGFVYDVANFYFSAPFILGYGGYIFKETESGLDVKDIGLANWGAIQGAKLIKRFFDEGILQSGDNYGVMDSLFKEDAAAMIINGPWAVKAYRDAGIDYGVTPIPDLDWGVKAKPFVGVQGFMVNAKSPNKLLATDFLTNFVAKKETLYKIYLADPRLPSREDVLEMVKDDPDVTAFTKSAAAGIPMPNVPEMGPVWGAMGDALSLIINDEQTPEEALKGAVEKIKAQIQK
ncbi:MAG: maltose/maltodextrin ABC transporter substrate-binding protein MalE [Thermotogae bacterium]|nr:maltose/maltodextrin ABC transporter substrate-binding protein MalE [Thermotogota bacterium]